MEIGIIGGTGVYDAGILSNVQAGECETPYGTVTYQAGEFAGKRIVFIARHGRKHSIAPHLINYRANIWALKKLGVHTVLATAAVGSLKPDMKLGDLVVLDQFVDFTKQRSQTFYEGGPGGVIHVDLTEPYCPALRRQLLAAGQACGFTVHEKGTYVCTEGPRFETPAEITMFARLGGDVVGMTNVPEVVLAREAELCYAAVAMVTNFAAGISLQPITYKEVVEVLGNNTANLRQLFMQTIKELGSSSCGCRQALQEYGGCKL